MPMTIVHPLFGCITFASVPCRVLAATNRPEALDSALRRPGRLDRELHVAPPNAAQRLLILRQHAASMPLSPAIDLAAIAASCSGYTAADLAAVCREAAMAALSQAAAPYARRHGRQRADRGIAMPCAGPCSDKDGSGTTRDTGGSVTPAHFEAALERVRPSLVRGLAVATTPLSWDAIGGLEVRKFRVRLVYLRAESVLVACPGLRVEECRFSRLAPA